MKTCSLFVLAMLWTGSAGADQIRNRYTSELLIVSDETAEVGVPGPRLETSEWAHEFRGTDESTGPICTRATGTRRCLIWSGDRLLLSSKTSGPSAVWRLRRVAGTSYYRLQLAAQPALFLHNERGALTVGGIQPGWWSAMWAFDEKPVADARSGHLNYPGPSASEYYIETRVLESHPSSYFAAIVCDGGYFGFQQLGGNHCSLGVATPTNRQIIFSLWNEDGSPEKHPPAAALATVSQRGPGVQQRSFSGEGSGAQTYKCFNWEPRRTHKFFLRAHVEGRHSVYRAYFRAPGDAAWRFIAEARRPAGGKLLQGIYSFVEDFGRNGNVEGVRASERTPFQRRAADFANPWRRAAGGCPTRGRSSPPGARTSP